METKTTMACLLYARLGWRNRGWGNMNHRVSRWFGVGLVIALLGWAEYTPLLAQSLPSGDETRRIGQVAPPPPAPVPPNASHISATVRKYSFWPPGSLHNIMPPVPRDHTFYSLMVEIHTSVPESSELDSLTRPGIVVEVFSSEVLASDLVGKDIEATLKLTGDTDGVRWWISNVRPLP